MDWTSKLPVTPSLSVALSMRPSLEDQNEFGQYLSQEGHQCLVSQFGYSQE